MRNQDQTGQTAHFARWLLLTTVCAVTLVACSPSKSEGIASLLADNGANAASAAETAAPAGNTAAPAPTVVGFDPAAAPMGTMPTGAWPYFSLLDGYEPLSIKNKPGDAAREFERDVAYDRYEFFDGKKLIPVEGRLYTVKAIGEGASIFQAEKTYEKLIHDLGGVTVWEGNGSEITDAKLEFSDQRHRGLYELGSEKGGTYMVRTPTAELWVEVWKRWQDVDAGYWLTIVEKKNLEMTARLLDAEQMKAALDADGHVALYLNFDTDAATIRPDGQPVIAEIVKLMKADPQLKLDVQGHTDSSGTPAHNQQLSAGRAASVMAALTAQGIAAGRLTANGYGQTKPIADNATADGKAKNRRVELVKR